MKFIIVVDSGLMYGATFITVGVTDLITGVTLVTVGRILVDMQLFPLLSNFRRNISLFPAPKLYVLPATTMPPSEEIVIDLPRSFSPPPAARIHSIVPVKSNRPASERPAVAVIVVFYRDEVPEA